jgi:hypothetical protein
MRAVVRCGRAAEFQSRYASESTRRRYERRCFSTQARRDARASRGIELLPKRHATAVASSSIMSSGSNNRLTPRSVHAGLHPSSA